MGGNKNRRRISRRREDKEDGQEKEIRRGNVGGRGKAKRKSNKREESKGRREE